MSEEIVRILTVQTGNSTQTINNLKQAIKSLRQELSKAQVGSKQYNDTLRELTQVQRQYSLINKDISERSKAQEVNLQTMAQLGQNLAKTYSSINAVIGLLGDNNEDLNKSMLKVQRTIQLIQGLSGIGGLIKQIPQLLNGFKSWLSSFDPLERKVVNIAKGINAIDGKKLNQIAGLQGGSIKIGDVSAKATAGSQSGSIPFDADRRAYQSQVQVITALNQARDNELERLARLKNRQAEQNKILEEAKTRYTAAQQTINQAGISISEFTQKISQLQSTGGKLTWTQEYEDNLKLIQQTTSGLSKAKSELASAEKEATVINNQIKETEGNIARLEKQIKNVGTTASKVGSFLKNVFSTVGWTLLISAIISGIYALGRWITNIQTAAKEVREFNKAIREGTAQGSAKAIVILKELSIAYQKVGDSAKAKEQFLVDYNDKIKETGIAVNDVNTADDVFIKNTAKYVKALEIRARAQATENYAIKKYEEYLIERDKLLEKRATAPTSNNPNPVGGGSFSPYNTNTILVQTVDDIDKAIKKLDTGTDSWMEDLFTKIANLKASIAGIFDTGSGSGSGSGGGSDTKENPFDIEAAILKTYLEDVERYQDSLKSAKDKEIEETEAFYDRLITNAAYFGQDYEQYVRAREAAVAEIEKKYADEELENQKKQAEDRLSELDAEINRIRSRYDTSNIQKVREQTFQTNYRQPVTTTALGLGPSWLNTYQSGQNVKDEYNAQVTYNNKILELTRLRIEQENALLNQQLEVEGITADRRMEIERTLAENKIALSDAVLDNEEANLQAYKKMQESRQQALNATLSVASNVMGGMASLMKAESENTKKSDKQRANSFKAYKAFSIAQAITDTYKAANESYSAMASIPYVGPALGAAAAIAAVIAGIANVRRIQNEEISTSSSSSSVAVTAPAMQTNPIEYQRQLLGDQELDELNKPMKCYVLESEITSTQNKVKVSESNSSF